MTAAFWNLDIDSELLFVGDGGITEPSRATRRYGVELGAYWTPFETVILDADYSWSHARFTEYDPAGDYIPGAVETVVSVGLSIQRDLGWFGGPLALLRPLPTDRGQQRTLALDLDR
ncbi:MAG: hypothetical protein IPJ97_18255 [Proteobacteria bacterium]|nr:hypothetical protein [Pseudomonadota bacterium]